MTAYFANRHQRALATVFADWESNPENYEAGGKVIQGRAPKAQELTLYANMRVFLTRNLNKENDFVNGMLGRVMAYDENSRCVEVVTESNKRVPVYPVTEDVAGAGRVVAYPIRAGYASTIYKMQGATLDHVTIYLDRPGVPAAGYVAMSRVRKDTDYLVAVPVKSAHFVPAL